MQPVVIVIGGQILETWTEMSLQRSKSELTGTLSVSIFAGGMPPSPLIREAKAGAEILCYIAGQLAFTGTVDKRQGTGSKKADSAGTDDVDKTHGTEGGGDTSLSSSIGPTEYTIKLSARGQTKRLIDSSHQHPTTNMVGQPTTKKVVEKLVEPWKTEVEWLGEEIKLDKIRFRDGGRVVDELYRVCLENCYFMYETRDGKLRVTDGVGTDEGDPLILGRNIMTFSAEQSEDEAKSKIKVKGQRTDKMKWGKDAVEKTFKEVEDSWVKDFVPLTVQHYGDADDKTLERRARFEMNKRSADSKKITIDVFHVQTPSGKPWDVGTTHYVEVPPEGIYDMFECTELTYSVNADSELKTTLTLSPPPSKGEGEGHGLDEMKMNTGDARRSQSGVSMVDGQFPAAWSPPQLSVLPFMTLVDALAKAVPTEDKKRKPPLTLPPWLGDRT
jgi:prophage tail gpP-like protein